VADLTDSPAGETVETDSHPRSHAEEERAKGDHHASAGNHDEAEACYERAIELDPRDAAAHSALGSQHAARGRDGAALTHFLIALRLDGQLSSVRHRVVKLLVTLGRADELWKLWSEIEPQEADIEVLGREMHQSLNSGDLTLASAYARLYADVRWGSRWYPRPHATSWVPSEPPNTRLTVPKLQHDADQFLYLQSRGVLGPEFEEIIDEYRRLAGELERSGVEARPLEPAEKPVIRDVYNRLVNVHDAPRVPCALSAAWDGATIERTYFNRNPGVVVVDDPLSHEALASLQRFCLESTVWSSNQHAYGRLGAHFQNGFNCPLLVQIAEELRATLPNLIGSRYPLRHIWGYKSPPSLPADSVTHADFAAVNVNFWITPDEANLDCDSGGLVIHGVEAPLHWDYRMYNASLHDVIIPFIQRQNPTTIRIPYRANRAIIFNSDLFHGTDGLAFRPEYEYRRVNITMLYGDREDDAHHRGLLRPDPLGQLSGPSTAWRSYAFARVRSTVR
jgi:tetratricopeptide (TPR) repeat protein